MYYGIGPNPSPQTYNLPLFDKAAERLCLHAILLILIA